MSVGGGLLVLGLTSYAFLAVAARNLPPRGFATLSVLWVLVYTAGPGIFLPLEQEVGRALADRRARQLGGGPLLRRAALLGAGVLVVLLAAVGLAGPLTVGHLFDGSWWLLAGLGLSLVGLWGAHCSRGAFAGSGKFSRYGTQLAVEGGSRLIGCLILAVAGVHSAGGYGVLVGAAFIVSVAATAPALAGLDRPGPEARWEELTGTLGWLAAGSVLSQALVNAGPVAVKVLATDAQSGAAGQLLAGLVLARLPLFLFAAVQAALLPGLAGLLAAARTDLFRQGIRRLLGVVAALTAGMTATMAAVGPALLHLFFGSRFRLGALDLALLSAATGLYMAANVLGNALLAMQRFRAAAGGWAIGVVVLAGALGAPASLFARVERGFLFGSGGALLALALLLRAALREGGPVSATGRSMSYAVLEP